MKNLISVIVPVFNSESYLRGCVESVLIQTYTYFELLLIDDGSIDSSREICESMAAMDKRIKVIPQKHQGVSAARNMGIKVSQGKYVFFLDADDMIHPQLLETLYRLLEEKGAAIATESRYYAGGGDFKKPKEWVMESESMQPGIYMDCKKAIEALIYGVHEAALYVMGGKMICREVLESVQFDEKLTHGEDTLFLYCLLEKGADVVVLDRNWYYYRIHGQGATSIFTISACQSRYKAEQYIRDSEIKYGRLSNAIHWEEAIVRAIVAWYEVGRSTRDDNLMKYAKKLAKDEKYLTIYSNICRYEKSKLFLVVYCYPLYRVLSVLEPRLLRYF